MIVGLGIDLVDLFRIERSLKRFGYRFVERIFHPDELVAMPSLANPPSTRVVEWTAARFAAKEAASKALGTGFQGGVRLHDIQIHRCQSGKPLLTFHNEAKKAALLLGSTATHLSMTHSTTAASAVVILDGTPLS